MVDEAALEELGANLDDPERMAVLDNGMDDPDGTSPPESEGSNEEAPGAIDESLQGEVPGTAAE